MKSKIFGSLVATAIAGLVAGNVALAEGKKKAAGGAKAKPAKSAEKCWSNECKGSVEGAKNECKGKMACKGVTKEACEKDGKGTWSEKAPG